MLDRIHIHQGSTHNTTTVTEKRAPTDESVRLLKEMQEAAKENLLFHGQLPHNHLDGVIYAMSDPATQRVTLGVRYELNGNTYRKEVHREFYKIPASGEGLREFFMELMDEVAKDISAHMLHELSDKDTIFKLSQSFRRHL